VVSGGQRPRAGAPEAAVTGDSGVLAEVEEPFWLAVVRAVLYRVWKASRPAAAAATRTMTPNQTSGARRRRAGPASRLRRRPAGALDALLGGCGAPGRSGPQGWPALAAEAEPHGWPDRPVLPGAADPQDWPVLSG